MPIPTRRLILAGLAAVPAAGCAGMRSLASGAPSRPANIVVASRSDAVGLFYERGRLPVVAFKSAGREAQQQVLAARTQGTPVAADEAAADALVRGAQVGQPISEVLFKPVARAFQSVGFKG